MFRVPFSRCAGTPTLKPMLTASTSRHISQSAILSARLTETIKSDHDSLRDSYHRIINAKDHDEKDRWRNQFSWDLARHSVGEEIVVYPQFEKIVGGSQGQEMADRDREHHLDVKHKLYALQDMPTEAAEFEPALKSLWASLSNHIEEEEKHDLPRLEESLSSDESTSMANTFERTKMFVPTKSHPGAPDKPPFETVVGMLTTPMDMMRDLLFKKYPHKEARK